MQVARIARGNRRRTYPEKIIEMFSALKLELFRSKKEILRIELSIDGQFDCATKFVDAEKTWEPNTYGSGSESEFENIYQNCISNIYGLKAAILLGKHYADNRQYKNKALEHYQKAYENYGNNKEIGMEALYGMISVHWILGDCNKVLEEINEYKNEDFSHQSRAYDERLEAIGKECDKMSDSIAHCLQLYPVTSGNKLNIILITDSDSSVEEFSEESKKIIEEGLFSDPFINEMRDQFAIYYINEAMSDEYTKIISKQETESDPYLKGLLDDVVSGTIQKEITRISTSCPPGIRVLLSDNAFGSFHYIDSDVIVISRNQINPKDNTVTSISLIFKHELGHAAFKLNDEYYYTDSGASDRPGLPNCFNTKAEAKRYWEGALGLKEGIDFNYYNGCSYTKDNIRGTETSIMKSDTSSPGFGPINEAYIKMAMMNYN